MQKKATLEITIPVLNEENDLEKNILKIYNYIKEISWDIKDWSITIADNGSTDKTSEISKKIAEEFTEINYIMTNEKGVGLALKKSWLNSKKTIVGYMDLDIATDLKHLEEAVSKIVNHDFDFVYGTRLHPKSKVIGRSIKREITSRCFNFILKALLRVKFSDGMCGFKFLKRDKFIKLYNRGAKSDTWFFSTELLVISEWENFKIFELPIKWTDSSDSRVKVIPLALKYLKGIVKLKQLKQ